jgi:hypothetical protein
MPPRNDLKTFGIAVTENSRDNKSRPRRERYFGARFPIRAPVNTDDS